MLLELTNLHREILSQVDELADLTNANQPQLTRLATCRLALTRASRTRSRLIQNSYNQIYAFASAQEKAALSALATEGRAALVISVNHIGKWTLTTIVDEWPEYCIVSRAMQASMRARVDQEAKVLYPMLATLHTRFLAPTAQKSLVCRDPNAAA